MAYTIKYTLNKSDVDVVKDFFSSGAENYYDRLTIIVADYPKNRIVAYGFLQNETGNYAELHIGWANEETYNEWMLENQDEWNNVANGFQDCGASTGIVIETYTTADVETIAFSDTHHPVLTLEAHGVDLSKKIDPGYIIMNTYSKPDSDALVETYIGPVPTTYYNDWRRMSFNIFRSEDKSLGVTFFGWRSENVFNSWVNDHKETRDSDITVMESYLAGVGITNTREVLLSKSINDGLAKLDVTAIPITFEEIFT
jgi:hypothetical protein